MGDRKICDRKINLLQSGDWWLLVPVTENLSLGSGSGPGEILQPHWCQGLGLVPSLFCVPWSPAGGSGHSPLWFQISPHVEAEKSLS